MSRTRRRLPHALLLALCACSAAPGDDPATDGPVAHDDTDRADDTELVDTAGPSAGRDTGRGDGTEDTGDGWDELVDSSPLAAPGVDEDGDGYRSRLPPPGHATGLDCDDHDPATHPGAPEIWYDGFDRDCDGASDWDRDRDGHEAPTSPLGGDDCDDLVATRSPGLPEVCDGFDDDCDDLVDEDDPDLLTRFLALGAVVWGRDDDGDGWVGAATLVAVCGAPPPGLQPLIGPPDCADAEPTVHPAAKDPAGDGVDQDCDGTDG